MLVNNIADQLRRDEGLRLKPYADTKGKITIGYGYNLTENGITTEIAELWLARKIAATQTGVSTKVPWSDGMEQVRRAVLWNMAYNMGVEGLLEFHDMLGLAAKGNYSDAARAMLASLWAKQVGDRAFRLSGQMAEGVWV